MGGFTLFKDDGTWEAKELLKNSSFNGHSSYVPSAGADWILSDTYSINGFQYLFL